jgi:hypothetical protein
LTLEIGNPETRVQAHGWALASAQVAARRYSRVTTVGNRYAACTARMRAASTRRSVPARAAASRAAQRASRAPGLRLRSEAAAFPMDRVERRDGGGASWSGTGAGANRVVLGVPKRRMKAMALDIASSPIASTIRMLAVPARDKGRAGAGIGLVDVCPRWRKQGAVLRVHLDSIASDGCCRSNDRGTMEPGRRNQGCSTRQTRIGWESAPALSLSSAEGYGT